MSYLIGLAEPADVSLLPAIELAAGRLFPTERLGDPEATFPERQLVQRVIDEAQTRHLQGVTLTTFADIPWNGPFYRSMDFDVIKVKDLTRALSVMLADERALGLTERVAMRRSVERSAGAGPEAEDAGL